MLSSLQRIVVKDRLTLALYDDKAVAQITVFTAIKSNEAYNNKDNISSKKEGEIVISIRDRGTGIDPEIQEKLFTIFVTKSETGSGLGLFISKGIVEAHGGKIWAENNADGKGATFSFSLPIS